MPASGNASYALDLVVVIIGVVLVLRKIANMDGYHKLRVVALTFVLSVIPILFFLGYALQLGRSGLSDCVIQYSYQADHY